MWTKQIVRYFGRQYFGTANSSCFSLQSIPSICPECLKQTVRSFRGPSSVRWRTSTAFEPQFEQDTTDSPEDETHCTSDDDVIRPEFADEDKSPVSSFERNQEPWLQNKSKPTDSTNGVFNPRPLGEKRNVVSRDELMKRLPQEYQAYTKSELARAAHEHGEKRRHHAAVEKAINDVIRQLAAEDLMARRRKVSDVFKWSFLAENIPMTDKPKYRQLDPGSSIWVRRAKIQQVQKNAKSLMKYKNKLIFGVVFSSEDMLMARAKKTSSIGLAKMVDDDHIKAIYEHLINYQKMATVAYPFDKNWNMELPPYGKFKRQLANDFDRKFRNMIAAESAAKTDDEEVLASC